jgi:hypothetical protein
MTPLFAPSPVAAVRLPHRERPMLALTTGIAALAAWRAWSGRSDLRPRRTAP